MTRFFEWWIQIISSFPQGLQAWLIILGAWIRKCCNGCVFNGAVPNIQFVFRIRNILEEVVMASGLVLAPICSDLLADRFVTFLRQDLLACLLGT